MSHDLSVAEKLSIGTPVVWVQTKEVHLATQDIISELGDRNIFRLHSTVGLTKYDSDTGTWKRYIKEILIDGDHIPVSVTSMAETFEIAAKFDKAVVLVEYGEKFAESILPSYIADYYNDFARAIKNNDADTLPIQIFVITTETEVPDSIERIIVKEEHQTPDKEDFEALLEEMRPHVALQDSISAIATSAVGLSQVEFIQAVKSSAVAKDPITASTIGNIKRRVIKNTSILELREPKFTISDLGGLDNAKKLINDIHWMWNNPEECKSLYMTPLRRLMMVGVPGVGKSLMCEAIASALQVDLAKGGVSQSMSKWIGESESNMREMFRMIKKLSPLVLWIDEFGRDLSGGHASGDGGTTNRVHGEFLTGLQELPDNVFLAAAANNIEELSPEMLRADRFDKIMFAGFPTHDERKQIFEIHLGEQSSLYNLDDLAEASRFFTGAEIKILIKEVRNKVGASMHRAPTTDEILKAIPLTKNRIWVNRKPQMLAMYKRAVTEWDWASSSQEKEAEDILSGKTGVPRYTPKRTMNFSNNG